MVHTYSLYFYSELYNDVATDPRAKYHTPVILMEGFNHGQFASGRMPSNVATHDLSPDVSNTTAYQRIANYTCSFVSYTLRNNTSSQWVLDEGFNKTYQLIQVNCGVQNRFRIKIDHLFTFLSFFQIYTGVINLDVVIKINYDTQMSFMI